jgi:hypothetical protein
MSLRVSLRRGAIALISATVLVGVAGAPASAAPDPIQYFYNSSGSHIGHFQWNADPYQSIPGESIRVCDAATDGWYIAASVADGGLEIVAADTAGHPAWYCTPWTRQHDAAENTSLTVRVWKVRGSESVLIGHFGVTS